MDHREQALAHPGSALIHSAIIAETGGSNVAPQLGGCNVTGNVNIIVNTQSDQRGVEQEMEPGGTWEQNRSKETNESVKRAQRALKTHLREKFKRISEGKSPQGHRTHLSEIYTELYITEGGSGGVNNQHEVMLMQNEVSTQETQILCNDIFKPLTGQDKPKAVLTKGIAGIGKTISVQKFILDWAEGKANQDVDFLFTLPFRDLNVRKMGEFSLMQLLHRYFPRLKGIQNIEDHEVKVLFVFDGLDECRLCLDFHRNEMCCDITEPSSVDVLLTSLIKGDLFPSALLWITSRPAAASQIPSDCIDRVTEVRGFNDPQKEEYFRKRIRHQEKADRIISHIKSSRSLYIMCHIPVFCWISATVLETMLSKVRLGNLPKTLTEMYTHFLLIQNNLKNQKYHGINETNSKNMSVSDREIILKLGQLAFGQLKKGNLIFYEEDLRESGIDVGEAFVYSGVCTEIFKEDRGLYREKVYCFVHLSIQEYLAALFVFLSWVNENRNVLTAEESNPHDDSVQLLDLHRLAVDKALESENGHLDLFLRFLVSLSLDSVQILLGGLLTETRKQVTCFRLTGTDRECTIGQYIKKKIREESSAERIINLFHCLNEIDELTPLKEIEDSLNSGNLSEKELEPHQCSALAFVLLNSEEVLDEFDLKKYDASSAGHQRLVPVVRHCRKAILNSGDLTEKSCDIVVSALQLSNSPLRDLDLSYNYLGDSGVKLLCSGLMSPNCKLQRLGLGWCNLTEGSCDDLASVLRSPHSELIDLELRDNELQDLGVRVLSAGLEDRYCKLQRLGLSGCRVTQRGCDYLASALASNPSHLRELDLRYNHPGDSGVRVLSAAKPDTLTLLVDHGGENRIKPGPRKYGCRLTLDPNTAHRELSLSEGNGKATHAWGTWEPHPDHPERFEFVRQVACGEHARRRCYWEAEFGVSDGGWASAAVASRVISRKGGGRDCVFGGNGQSWSLACHRHGYFLTHNGKQMRLRVPPCPYRKAGARGEGGGDDDGGEGLGVYRVGVYVDLPAGALSFYSICDSDAPALLCRLHTNFTELKPLCFGFHLCHSSVSLCQLE